jgi:hypothetical protein
MVLVLYCVVRLASAYSHTVNEMVAAFILAFAVVAVGQFWMIWWRATVGSLAETPLSDKIRAAARLDGNLVSGNDFQALASMFESCPSLRRDNRSLRAVQTYYRVVSLLARICVAIPAVAQWTQNEMATCARYAAVCVDQRMQRTRTILAEMRSY